MSNEENKTSVHIVGFWFHIKWNNEHDGYDQHGNLWVNKDNPICENSLVDACLDAYNEIIESLNEQFPESNKKLHL